jgi:hypothetical protein
MVVPSLTRRAFLAGGAASLLSGPAAAETAAVHSAAAFTDSVGVNTHLSSEPYASRFELVRDLLGAAGIRHVRDELRPSNNLGRLRELFELHGIRSDLLVSPATNTVRQMLDYLEALGLEKVSAIEGQNEGDSDWFKSQWAAHRDWSAAVIAYQREVFEALRPLYPEALLPILSPTVLDWKPDDAEAIRDAARFCDIVAIHSYAQHGEEPETDAPYSALSWYLRNIRDRLKPGAPVMSTETGYNTLLHPGGAGVSEAAAAAYIPRLLLNNFAAGIRRTFLYEFLDEGGSPADMEQHWGLVRHDGTPKPAYHALAALLGALSGEEGAQPSKPAPAAALHEAPADARMLQFRKADGSTVAAIWRAVRCWDPAAMRDVPVQAAPLTIALDGPALKAAFLALEQGASWRALPVSSNTVTAKVAAGPVLVRVF